MLGGGGNGPAARRAGMPRGVGAATGWSAWPPSPTVVARRARRDAPARCWLNTTLPEYRSEGHTTAP